MNFVEIKKLDNFFKFKRLLKEFVRNPEQYDTIVIRTDFVGAKRGCCTRKMFDGSEAIKEHYDEILETMTSLLLKYDISYYLEGEYITATYFNDDSDVNHKKIISVFCFKN